MRRAFGSGSRPGGHGRGYSIAFAYPKVCCAYSEISVGERVYMKPSGIFPGSVCTVISKHGGRFRVRRDDGTEFSQCRTQIKKIA